MSHPSSYYSFSDVVDTFSAYSYLVVQVDFLSENCSMFIVWLTGLMCSSSLHSCTLMSKLMLVSFTLFRNLLSSSNRWRRNCRLCKSKCVLVRIVLTMLNKQNIWLRDVRCFLFFLILHYLSCFTFYTHRTTETETEHRTFDYLQEPFFRSSWNCHSIPRFLL